MATTTNFGWETPDDTDLVKDGALAMRTLGNAIDASLVDLKGGTTGQVLSKTSNTDMDFTWVTSDDANAIQNAIVDAKGDLITATAADTPSRIAVGNNGETLVADSSASTGLRWQGNFAAGKNAVINGDFAINQRNFTSGTGANDFGFDRWQSVLSGATATYSAQTFTLGTAPVAGYEAKNFARLAVTTGNDFCRLQQSIESVRTFAGQTVTLSFWAKGTNPTTAGNLRVNLQQSFGTGGSPSSAVTMTEQTFTLTANWTRYSFTFILPSIAGKTLGTNGNDYLAIFIGQLSNNSTDAWTLDIWGVQLEAGNVATAFQTATGTLAGELAACQKYYETSYNQGVTPADGASSVTLYNATAYSSGASRVSISYKVQKRSTPTITFYRTTVGASAGKWNYYNSGWVDSTTTIVSDINTVGYTAELAKSAGYVAGYSYLVSGDWTASAEL